MRPIVISNMPDIIKQLDTICNGIFNLNQIDTLSETNNVMASIILKNQIFREALTFSAGQEFVQTVIELVGFDNMVAGVPAVMTLVALMRIVSLRIGTEANVPTIETFRNSPSLLAAVAEFYFLVEVLQFGLKVRGGVVCMRVVSVNKHGASRWEKYLRFVQILTDIGILI